MQTLYPEIEPFKTQLIARETLADGKQHQIYVEQCGNPDGIPVVFLHGGPGSGCGPQHRRYFDPTRYHIILFDQRGCGRSLPAGLLENNDTPHLIEDMQAIRKQLDIQKWLLFGGSWGATLALCYAKQHTRHVSGIILRGTFLGRQQDIDWVYAQGGASTFFSEAWHAFVEAVPDAEKARPLTYYFSQLNSPIAQQRRTAGQTLQSWEATIVKMRDSDDKVDDKQAPGPYEHALIQLHFALNHCFITDRPILENLTSLVDLPINIIHGRYDMVCRLEQSWQIKQQLPHANFSIVPLAGHAASEPGLIDALVDATNKFALEFQ